ncbi:hypothetical protein PO124_01510 [Bacillus licheniformis]|nr:hypothetical protein [Bacillus licheniformis]
MNKGEMSSPRNRHRLPERLMLQNRSGSSLTRKAEAYNRHAGKRLKLNKETVTVKGTVSDDHLESVHVNGKKQLLTMANILQGLCLTTAK